MFWGKDKQNETEAEAQAPPSDVALKPIPRQKLPHDLQSLVDRDDHFYDDIYSPYSVDSTETPFRYAGYANRIRTILLSAHRYVAYTSDIGESFRPVAHPYLVRTAYGISWTYLIGDVAHEGYKAYLRNRHVLAPPSEAYKDAKDQSHEDHQVVKSIATSSLKGPLPAGDGTELAPWPTAHVPLIEDYRMVMAQRAVFQSLASMGLPAFTIHTVVKYSGRMFKNSKTALFRTWAPIGLGLSIVPFLPYLFDKPVEEAVEWAFHTGLRAYGGEDAVRALPIADRAPHEEATSLGHFIKVEDGKPNNSSTANTDAANVSWEAFKEEKLQANEQRKREREEHGHGPLAFLGFKREPKSKTE